MLQLDYSALLLQSSIYMDIPSSLALCSINGVSHSRRFINYYLTNPRNVVLILLMRRVRSKFVVGSKLSSFQKSRAFLAKMDWDNIDFPQYCSDSTFDLAHCLR